MNQFSLLLLNLNNHPFSHARANILTKRPSPFVGGIKLQHLIDVQVISLIKTYVYKLTINLLI